MRPPLEGGTTLITGASSGIGRALARELAPVAGRLVLVARRRPRLEELAVELAKIRADLPVHVMPCDLSDRAAIELFVEGLAFEVPGGVDVLINNAGFGDVGLFERADWHRTADMIELNVVALTLLTRRLVEPMVARGRGGILNISSGFGLTFLPGFAAYVGTKHYVTGFTEGLRSELQGTGVVVTQVCPGPVATEFEAVAGNPTGHEVPRFLVISPERCARAALGGFRKGRALIVPGVVMRLVIGLGALTPRWLQRLVYRPVAAQFRKAAALPAAPPAGGASAPAPRDSRPSAPR